MEGLGKAVEGQGKAVERRWKVSQQPSSLSRSQHRENAARGGARHSRDCCFIARRLRRWQSSSTAAAAPFPVRSWAGWSAPAVAVGALPNRVGQRGAVEATPC